jgi:hypothetical protein
VWVGDPPTGGVGEAGAEFEDAGEEEGVIGEDVGTGREVTATEEGGGVLDTELVAGWLGGGALGFELLAGGLGDGALGFELLAGELGAELADEPEPGTGLPT